MGGEVNLRLFDELCNMPDTEIIRLENLTYEQVRQGMLIWLGANHVSDKLVDMVFSKSGGHPLFSEELCKLMLNDNLVSIEDGKCKISQKAQNGAFGLPNTISALMTSRLDRVTPSQQLALKHAAVIGMEFYKHELYELIIASGSENVDDIRRGIDNDVGELQRIGLVSKVGGSATSVYRFANAMLKESAYNLLLFKDRMALHLKFAQYIENRNKDYLEAVYGLLANHYYLAEEYKEEIMDKNSGKGKTKTYLELAGDDALSVHGMDQVWICFERLLSMDEAYLADVSIATRAGWNQKAGEALLHLGKPKAAEDHFYKALNLLGLDNSILSDGNIFSCLPLVKGKPRLVKQLPSFIKMQENNEYDLFLAGAKVYTLLGKLDSDRDSVVALERRMNAMHLAEASSWVEENSNKNKQVSSAVKAELARAYANAAVFYTGITKANAGNVADHFSKKAIEFVDLVDNVETQASVHLKCSEYYLMVGRLNVAEDQIRKASWMCRFVNFENMLTDCLELSITLATFSGKVGKAKKLADRTNVQSADPRIIALWARSAMLCGDFDQAQHALERYVRHEPGSFEKKFDIISIALETVENPEIHIATSLLYSRKYKLFGPAMGAALRASEILLHTTMSHMPLVGYHTCAFLLTAFNECMVDPKERKLSLRRLSNHFLETERKVMPDEIITREMRKRALRNLKPIMALLNKYAKVYSPCLPHTIYCQAIYQKLCKNKINTQILSMATEAANENKTVYIKALALYEIDKSKTDKDAKITNSAVYRAFQECVDSNKKNKEKTMEDDPYELKLLNMANKT